MPRDERRESSLVYDESNDIQHVNNKHKRKGSVPRSTSHFHEPHDDSNLSKILFESHFLRLSELRRSILT
jgi:hypothetical protein